MSDELKTPQVEEQTPAEAGQVTQAPTGQDPERFDLSEEFILLGVEPGGEPQVVTGVNDQGEPTLEPLGVASKRPDLLPSFNKHDDLLSAMLNNLKKGFGSGSELFAVAKGLTTSQLERLGSLLKQPDANRSEIMKYADSIDEHSILGGVVTKLSEKDIPWDKLEADFGITKDQLKAGDGENYNRLLNWQKTDLMVATMDIPGYGKVEAQAKLSLMKDADGNIHAKAHYRRESLELNKPYLGYTFTEEDKQLLKETGHLGKTVELRYKNSTPFMAYVSVDKDTNTLTALRSDRIYIPEKISGKTLTKDEQDALREGKPVHLDGLVNKHGKMYSAVVQVSAEKKGLDFSYPKLPGQGHDRFMSHVFTPEEKSRLKAGETVSLQNVTTKTGIIIPVVHVAVDPTNGKLIKADAPKSFQSVKTDTPKSKQDFSEKPRATQKADQSSVKKRTGRKL